MRKRIEGRGLDWSEVYLTTMFTGKVRVLRSEGSADGVSRVTATVSADGTGRKRCGVESEGCNVPLGSLQALQERSKIHFISSTHR